MQVVSVSGDDWSCLAAGRDKAEYLALKLCHAGVPVAAFGATGPPATRHMHAGNSAATYELVATA